MNININKEEKIIDMITKTNRNTGIITGHTWTWRISCICTGYYILLILTDIISATLVITISIISAIILTKELHQLLTLTTPVTTQWLNNLPDFSFLKIIIPRIRAGLLKLQLNNTSLQLVTICSPGIVASSIERRFVWSWYSQYVSKEIAFPFACKELLDLVVSEVFQMSINVDTIHLTSDSLLIILKHCKEYKRAVKLKNRNEKGSIEDYYRNSHPTSLQISDSTLNRSRSPQSHCLALVKSLLKELLPWELWGTPHALLLSSILAKQLEYFISNSLSDPVWLKNQILRLTADDNSIKITKKAKETFPLIDRKIAKVTEDVKPEIVRVITEDTAYNASVQLPSRLSESKLNESAEIPKTSIESALTNMISNSTAPILQRAELEESPVKSVLQNKVKPELKQSPVFTKKSRPIEIINNDNGTNFNLKQLPEVKIYDKVIEGSVRTWNNDNDLECVSLGHDLLASLDKEVDLDSRLGRLWETDGAENTETSQWSPNAPSTGSSTKASHALWFGEDDNLDVDSTEDSPPKNMDEAAGVMEGILDFGMAGLRKGLRLTRLQESPQEKANLPAVIKGAESSIVSTIDKVLTTSRKNSQSDESSFKSDVSSIIEKNAAEKPINNCGVNILTKQNRVMSQDAAVNSSDVDNSSKMDSLPVPVIADALESDSPEYEYEEPADFASTIAKLRCLLQQKTGDTTPVYPDQNGEFPMMKLDSADEFQNCNPQNKSEETISVSSFDSESGFTMFNPHFSEEAEEALHHKSGQSSLFGSSSNISQSNVNNIQKLDKLFTRTVTGVFNTIKSAVGGDSSSDVVSGQADGLGQADRQRAKEEYKEEWIYIESDADLSVAISRLLMERRGFCVVEAAQDSLEIFPGSKPSPNGRNVQKRTIVTDDFEESELISSCPLWHMCTEIVALTLEGALQKDVVVKSISVAVADIMESKLEDELNKFTQWLRMKIVQSFQELSKGIDDTYVKSDKAKEFKSSDKEETPSEQLEDVDLQLLCDAIFKYIPDAAVKLLGREEIIGAFEFLLSSIENQTINKDVIYNLLDILVSYFLRACSQKQPTITPPPSA